MSATSSSPRRVMGSVLDRLLDADPDREREAPAASLDIAALRFAVRRDLEHLLNARRPWRTPSYPALRSSPLGYGLVDFTSGALNEARARDALRDEIADTIRRFEPRLTQVSVAFVGDASPLQQTLRLRITAMLIADPAPEAVSFDTTFEASTSDVVIKPVGRS